MHSYLSLLGLSQKDATLEASCGVLQNLTASKDAVSSNNITLIEGKGCVLLFSLFIVFDFHQRDPAPCPRLWFKSWGLWLTFHLF